MGFELEMDTEATLKVIVSKDKSIKALDEEIYESYLEDLDESKLVFDGEPTRFILKKTLEYKDSKRVMNSQVSVGEDNKPQVTIGFMMDEVRFALVGMEGPGSDKFAKDKNDGYAHRKVVNALYNSGVLMDLYNGRKNGSGDVEESKKS
jgi:hypothetical protein